MANLDENAKAKKKTRPKKRIKIEKNSLSGGVLTTWNDSEGHPIKSIFSKTLEKGTDLLVGNKQVVGIWMAVALFFSIASGGIIPLVAIGIGLAVVGGARSYTSGKYDKIQKTKEAYEEYLGEDEGKLVELDEKLGLDFEEVENIQYQIEDIHKEMEILTEQNAGVECKDWLPEQRDKYYKLEQQSIKLKRSFTNLKRSVSNSKIEAAKLKENLEMLYSILKIKEEDQLDLDNLCVQNFDEFFGELDAAYKEAREFVENRRIYFDLHTQKVIEDFFDLAIEALSGTHIYEKGVTRNLAKFDVKRDEINDLVMKKLPESVKALESEFAIIMGVKQKKEPEINSG
jgi:hypothetical protein